MKPGYKTSEFWLTVVATLIGLLFASGAVEEASGIGKIAGLAASVLATLGYSYSRGAAKSSGQ